MTLLITAGLLTRGLVRSRAAQPGFETRTVYFLRGVFGNTQAAAMARQRRVLDRLQSLPMVSHIAEGDVPLLGTWTPPVVVDGMYYRALGSYADETYLETLGIPLVRGRGFARQEVERHAPLAIVSEAAARRFWPAQDPVGRHIQLDMDFRRILAEFEVIGVAKDVRFGNLTRPDPADARQSHAVRWAACSATTLPSTFHAQRARWLWRRLSIFLEQSRKVSIWPTPGS